MRSQLLSTDQVKSSNVKVTTENSEVFLMGLVTDREGRAAADISQPGKRRIPVTTALPTLNKDCSSGSALRLAGLHVRAVL